MSTTNLASQLLNELQGKPADEMATSLGITSEQAQTAMSSAIPLLLAGLGQNASKPEGADSLMSALTQDHSKAASSNDLGGLLGTLAGQFLGGGTSNVTSNSDGAGILKHIFGNKLGQAETQFGQATGLSAGVSDQLLKMLAPIVMAFLAKQVMSGNINSNDLGATLGAEKDQLKKQSGLGGMLGSILDQDGDGQFGLSDLVKLGAGILNKR